MTECPTGKLRPIDSPLSHPWDKITEWLLPPDPGTKSGILSLPDQVLADGRIARLPGLGSHNLVPLLPTPFCESQFVMQLFQDIE
jgi:hypothetical protein